MTDQYRLKTTVETGHVNAGNLGTFAIENREVVCDDYDTASELVERYQTVEWPGGNDPGPPEGESSDEAEAESKPESSDAVDDSDDDQGNSAPDDVPDGATDTDEFDAVAWLDERTVSEVKDDLESIDDADTLRDLRDASDRTTATAAIEDRLDEVEATDENGGSESESESESD